MWTRPGRAAGPRPHPIRAAGTGERQELINEYTSIFIFQTMRKRIADKSLLPN